MNDTATYFELHRLTAQKASPNAEGGIVYAILKDATSTEIYFTLLENQGGSGCFGREVVPFASIEACLEGTEPTAPIPAKRFRKAFINSRSVNNAGFLVACLRHQSLLRPAPDASHQHVIGGDWAAWKAKMLETHSDAVFIRPEAEKPSKAEAVSIKPDGKKEKKTSKGKKVATVGTEGEGYADPA